ncbi:MAG: aromatic ring-hydroxylating oxygenase subunit alpha [Candidatus Eiseniibacteriota bacterium]
MKPVTDLLRAYDPDLPLAKACTPPAAWYTDPRIADLERRTVFGRNGHCAARLDQVADAGRYVTTSLAGEPLVIVRGADGVLRAFYNVCRHHAAAVMTEAEGQCSVMRCPYHAWTYGLDGKLRGTPEFDGVEEFDRGANGLLAVRLETWEGMAFVNLSGDAPPLAEYLGAAAERIAPLGLSRMRFFERRSYPIGCNWKVYVDNYLDGGYHVPFLHHQLAGVLENKAYTIELERRACLQWSPMTQSKDAAANDVRRGDKAYYWWIHPNFMLNWYEGVMDTNIVYPLGADRCLVVFDFWFEDVSPEAEARNRKSVEVGERVQQEDVDICVSVQRGLGSRAYDTGRLSVRREAGEQLFHRLLHADLSAAV